MYLAPGARPMACGGALVPATRCCTCAGGRPAACHALRLYPGRPAWRLPLDRAGPTSSESLDSFATTTLDSQPLPLFLSLLQRPLCAVASPHRLAAAALHVHGALIGAQRLIRSAKPLIPPATFRLPRAALALAGPRALSACLGPCSSIPLHF